MSELIAAARGAGQDASQAEAAMHVAAQLVDIPNAGGRYSSKILPNPQALFQARRQLAEAIEQLSPHHP